MNKRRLLIGGVGITAVAVFWLSTRSAAHAPARAEGVAATLVTSTQPPEPPQTSRSEPASANHVGSPQARPFRPTPEARALADAARTRIASNKAQMANDSMNGAAARKPVREEEQPMPAPVGSGNQLNHELGQYVQSMMNEQFFPMGSSCYEQFTPKGSKVSGRVVLDVTVVGDKSVGGVVDEVKVSPDTTMKDNEDLVSCLRESMMAMIFRAPPNGTDKLTFTMPLEFSPQSDANPTKH